MCDKEWHHYVVNVEFPSVSLFVDGASFEPFLVTEDYPLRPSKIDSQLTIGACWQGKAALPQPAGRSAPRPRDVLSLCRPRG